MPPLRPALGLAAVWGEALLANAETGMCSDGEAAKVWRLTLDVWKSRNVHAAPTHKSAFMLLQWAGFHPRWRRTGEMMKAAVHEACTHSIGLRPGCGLSQAYFRKVRATNLRSPPCWKKVTSISVSKSAVTMKDFPWLVCKKTDTEKWQRIFMNLLIKHIYSAPLINTHMCYCNMKYDRDIATINETGFWQCEDVLSSTGCSLPWQWAVSSDSEYLAEWSWTSPSHWAPVSRRSGRAGTPVAWCPFPPTGSCAASRSSQRWPRVPPVGPR